MAKDDKEDRYKEGVDFEWVKAKGSNYRTRRFFSKAEKRARAEKKNASEATTDDKPTGSTKRSTESAPKTSSRPKARPARSKTGTPQPEMAAGKDKDRPRSSSRQGVMARRSTRDRLGNVSAPAPETPSQRTAFGDVPISSPHRDEALSRRKAEAEARAKARAEGGRESPLGRMVDRIFGGKEPSTGSSSRRDSRSNQGMAKGGMVMTNKGKVGASMVPTQNKFRTQTRKGKK